MLYIMLKSIKKTVLCLKIVYLFICLLSGWVRILFSFSYNFYTILINKNEFVNVLLEYIFWALK